MSDTRRILSAVAYPFLLSSVTAVVCFAIAGLSLGLFLSGLIVLTVLAPSFALAEERNQQRLIALVAVLTPVILIWLLADTLIPAPNEPSQTSTSQLRRELNRPKWGEVFGCVVVAIAYAGALAGLSVSLRRARFPSALAAGLSIIVGLFWLTWPIWMSRTWKGEYSAASVARVASLNPAMLVDAQLIRAFGPWSELSVAYHLTDLNQIVSYSPPQSIWLGVLFHGVIAASGFGLSAIPRRRRELSDTPPAAPITEPSA